jgi:hypothetical protein
MTAAERLEARPEFDRVPSDLTSRRQWVVWRLIGRDGKLTKIPYQSRSPYTLASSTDPATWSTFEEAKASYYAGDGLSGIGYVFSVDDPFLGVDFDRCYRDGEVMGWADGWTTRLGGYQEISPSGLGIKAIVRGSMPGDRHKRGKLGPDGSGAVEVYDRERFFTITGEAINGSVIGECAELAALYAEWFPPEPKRAKRENPGLVVVQINADDSAILDMARKARNGPKFSGLFDRGDLSGYASASEATLALARMLAFWTGCDPTRIDQLFRASALFREKWDSRRGEKTWGEHVIDKVLDGEFYQPTITIRHPTQSRKTRDIDKKESPEPQNDEFCNIAGFAGPIGISEIEWDEPLRDISTPVPPFPLEVFPFHLKEFVLRASEAIQCPVDYLAVPMLAVAGGVIGQSVNIRLSRTYVQAPNLYASVVGPPGSRKSPPLHVASAPAFAIDRANRERYAIEKMQYEQARAEWDGQRKGDRGNPPTPPTMVSLTIDDATREAVAMILGHNPRGLVAIRDELTSWVASLNAYKVGGKGDDKQFWLKVFSNSAVRVDRKAAANEPIIIPSPCVTVIGCLTPDTLPQLRDDKRDDGWLDRILFAYPDHEPADEWSEDDVADELIKEWKQTVQRLWQVQPDVDVHSGRTVPHELQFDAAAWVLWKEWIKAHRAETRADGFPKSLRGPWSKYEGITARLALILACVHNGSVGLNGPIPKCIEALDLRGAITLIDYFKAHFRKARDEFATVREDGSEDADALVAWLHRSAQNSPATEFGTRFRAEPEETRWFRHRDLTRQFNWWTDERQKRAVSVLVRRRILVECRVQKEGQGRPSGPVYVINPHLWSQF